MLCCISVILTKEYYSIGKFEYQCFLFNMLKYDVANENNNGNKLFSIIFFKKLFNYQIIPRTIPYISIFYSQTLKIHIFKYKKYDMCHNSLLYLILFHFINNTRNVCTERQTLQKEVKVCSFLKCNTKFFT